MNICLKKTIVQIDHCLPDDGRVNTAQLRKMYNLALRLQSQLLSVIYDMETFSGNTERISNTHSGGENKNAVVTLTIAEPLPSMKRLTESVVEHWKAMLEIEIITTRGSDNAQLWDTSNRAIQVIFNNLKGIFFEDDNMEHMAFSVVGEWGEKGATMIRVLDFDKSRQIRGIT